MVSLLDDLDRPAKETALRLAVERFRRHHPPLLEWAQRVYRVEGGEVLDFDLFPFQPEIYRAFGDRELGTVSVMKSAQCGVTAAGVSLALHAADEWGANVLYILPGLGDSMDFVDTRVKPVLEASPYLTGRVGDTDNKGLKAIGSAFVYFRHSVSAKKALSIPVDVLIFDEYDRLHQGNIPAFRKRLGSPTSMKLERRFSNPSYPDEGIHGLFLETDQRSWLVRCPSCRREAPMSWESPNGEHFVDEDLAARVCGRCHRPLPARAIAGGRWVAARPKVAARGYHITKLMVPGENIAALVAEHAKTDETSVEAHFNYDLGLPYSPSGGQLSREVVLSCRREYVCPPNYTGADWVTAGVDVGRVLHVRISRWLKNGKAAPLFLGEVNTFDELEHLWDRYNVNLGLVDERPEEKKAREFMNKFPGRCLLVRWAGEDQRDPIALDEDRGLVIARRTAACDRTVAAFSAQARYLPRELPKGYVAQLTTPLRVTETNTKGQKVAKYLSPSLGFSSAKQDHFFFCETYDLIARECRTIGEPAGASVDPGPGIREKVQRSRWRA